MKVLKISIKDKDILDIIEITKNYGTIYYTEDWVK